MKAIVLGSTGMIGGCFVRQLLERGWSVTGVARHTAMGRLHGDFPCPFVGCDVLDREQLESVFRSVQPDLIVHMAAQAFNGASWDAEATTYAVNVGGTRNVLAAARAVCPDAKVLLPCSSAEYGDGALGRARIDEETPLRPVTPYGVTKVATECMGYQYFRNYGMRVYLPRMFIHVGTGHPPATAIQNFARQIVRIKLGLAPAVLHTGRLDTKRDVIDVRDGVDGMIRLLESGEPGRPVNICNGEAPSMGELLDEMVALVGINAAIAEDPSLRRLADEPVLVGDNARLRALGWRRGHTLSETLSAVLDDWMARLGGRAS